MRHHILLLALLTACQLRADPVSTSTRAATEKWVSQRFASTQDLAAVGGELGGHTNRTDNPHGVTAAQIGALTEETDEAALAALAAYAAYWPRNATASSWFSFVTNSGAITITGYNIAGGTDVVIPDYINGLPVTEIGANAFMESGVTSIGGAGNVVTVGFYAFADCGLLASVSLPQAQMVEAYAFFYCTSLTSLYFDNDAPTIGFELFSEIPPNQVTNYVTNPQATGWGATLGGMPVVRLQLYADAVYQAGELVATVSDIEAHNADAAAHAGKVSVTGGTATNLTLAGSVTYTNGLTFGHGYYTNGPDYGVFYSINGTNYWELLK